LIGRQGRHAEGGWPAASILLSTTTGILGWFGFVFGEERALLLSRSQTRSHQSPMVA
jgi:hypothetical protein